MSYGKVHFWDHKRCPLQGGNLYCVLYSEVPLKRGFTCIHTHAALKDKHEISTAMPS